MKNISLALAIGLIAASSSVNAATIYEKDGFKFEVDGDIQIQLRQRLNTSATQKERAQIDIDDSELKNKISYDLGNDLTAFAEAHFDNGKDNDGAVESEETFLGLKNDNLKFQLGRMDYVTDSFATERGIEEPGAQSAFDAADLVNGSDVILVEYAAGAFTFAFSHDFGSGGTSSRNRNTSVQSSDFYVTTAVNKNFTLGFAAQNAKANVDAEKSTAYGINAEFNIDNISIDADYSKRDDTAYNGDNDLIDLKVTNLSVSVPVANTTKATVGITQQSNKAGTVDDSWYANVVYKFPKAKNVSMFAEIQNSDAAASDMGFLAGMRIKF